MRVVISTIIALVLVFAIAPAAGAQGPAPRQNVTDIAVCNEEAHRRAGGPSAAPREADKPRTLTPEPGTQTDSSGTIIAESKDPLLEGMAAEGLADPQYRTAYRECMAARAARGR